MNRWAITGISLGAIVAAPLIYWTISIALRDELYAFDGPATQAAVLKIVPIGSKIELAKTIMEAKGFRCLMQYNKGYAGDDPAGRHQTHYPAGDFLWCDSERTLGIFISKRWQVIFVEKDETVASVVVGVGLTGL
jgi:hypothetical protein